MSAIAASLPPGPRMPRALQTLGWETRTVPFLERCRKRYGDMFTLRIQHEGTWVMLSDPDAVKQVFTGDPRLLHAGEANKVLLPLVGRHSVLLLDERAHLEQRKLMLPPFHGERMQRYGELMTRVVERELDRWPAGVPLELAPRMQSVALEIIIRAVFGVHDEQRLELVRARIQETLGKVMTLRAMLTLFLLGPERVSRWRYFQRELDPMNEALYEEIRARRGVADLEQREDILSLLVQARHEDGSPMSDEELRDELVTLLVAGHETTATGLAWAFERLVRHPGKLARLRAEAEAGEHEYADAVAKETLRLRPVIPGVVRRLREPMEIGGRLLPAGVTVAPSIVLLHRRPDLYPEPYSFRPERFLGDDGGGAAGRAGCLPRTPGTYTWIPFGGGVRRCIGASFALFEMRTVLTTLARRLRLDAPDPRPERIRRRTITLFPDRGAEVTVA